MNYLRKYHLASEDGPAWDKSYSLIFTQEGTMFVRMIKDFEQPYKTPDVEEIEPVHFAKILVNGTILSELVARKLDEILPADATSATSHQ